MKRAETCSWSLCNKLYIYLPSYSCVRQVYTHPNSRPKLREIFISVINQLDTQNCCFTISLFHASTCFEHMCSSSGSQNCITQPLVSSQPVHGTTTYRCDDTRGCVMQFWPPEEERMCSKHVEAWNKLIVKQKFCALSWLITEIKYSD